VSNEIETIGVDKEMRLLPDFFAHGYELPAYVAGTQAAMPSLAAWLKMNRAWKVRIEI